MDKQDREFIRELRKAGLNKEARKFEQETSRANRNKYRAKIEQKRIEKDLLNWQRNNDG